MKLLNLLKRKTNKTPEVTKVSLEEFLAKYDKESIAAALNTLHDSFAWEVFRAYLRLKQREFEVAALDLSCQDGNTLRGAKASGIACGLEEVSERLVPEFINYLKGHSGVVENNRPE